MPDVTEDDLKNLRSIIADARGKMEADEQFREQVLKDPDGFLQSRGVRPHVLKNADDLKEFAGCPARSMSGRVAF